MTASCLLYYAILYLMSLYPWFENFNNFYMNFSSSSFYLSTILVVTLVLICDNACRKLLYLFNYYEDPMKIKIKKLEGNMLVNKSIEANTCCDLFNKF